MKKLAKAALNVAKKALKSALKRITNAIEENLIFLFEIAVSSPLLYALYEVDGSEFKLITLLVTAMTLWGAYETNKIGK